jgi:hypothetical protein
VRPLKELLQALPALETMRLPFNGYSEADVSELVKLLEQGLAPGLRVLDLSNSVAPALLTKAVTFFRNKVSPEAQQRIDAVLAARRGEATPTVRPAVKAERLEQQNGFPFAERAKSGMSKCVVCKKRIADGAVRIGVERELPEVGRITAWLHPECRAECPELRDLDDLEARLTRNSSGVWPVESQLA